MVEIYRLVMPVVVLMLILGGFARAETVCLPFNLKFAGAGARSIWIGSTIPKDIQKQIQEIQREIILSGAKGEPENLKRLHVTLKYLGSVNRDPEAVDYIRETLRDGVPIIPLTMKIVKIGILNQPRSINPRLVWAELDSQPMHATFNHIENALDNFCIRETRRYKPHITLFNFGDGQEKNPLPQKIADKIKNIKIKIPEFEVKGFKLLQSVAPPQPNIALAKFKKSQEKDPFMTALANIPEPTGKPVVKKRCRDLIKDATSADHLILRALDIMKQGATTSRAISDLRQMASADKLSLLDEIERKWSKVRKKMADLGSSIIMKRKAIGEARRKLTDEDLCRGLHINLLNESVKFLLVSQRGIDKVIKMLDKLI